MSPTERTGALLLAVALACGVTPAIEPPAASKSRLQLVQRWNSTLERAGRALAEGRTAEAESLYHEVLEQAGADGQRNLMCARAADALADLYRAAERPDRAAALYRRAADLWEHLLGADQPRLAVTLHNLGLVYSTLGQWEDAAQTLERALAIWERHQGADSEDARNTRRAYDAARRRAGVD